MAKPKPKKKVERPQAPARTKKRRSRRVVIAVVAGAAAVILVAALWLRNSERAGLEKRAGAPAGEPLADDLALREEAVAVARQLVTDFPRDAGALGLMGTVYNQFGNSAEAETWWRKCFELHPGREDVYEVLALAYLGKGEYEKVIDLSRRTMAASPRMPGVHRCLAQAYLEMGQLDDALDAIEKEREIDPANNEVYVVLGGVQLQRKAYPEAMNAYAKALELRPNDSRCYFGLSSAAARLGESEKAAEYQAKFEALRATEDAAAQQKRRATDVIAPAGPTLAETLVDAGRTYYANDRIDRAQACWRRAVELAPTARNYFLLGQASYKLHDRKGALAAIRRASELEPNNAEIRQAYRQLQREP